MKNEHTLHLTHEVSGSLQAIYPYFSDLTQFGFLHPLMVEVTNQYDQTRGQYYLIREAVYLLGMIPFFPEYTARVIEVEPGKHLRYVAQVRPTVQLDIDWIFTEDLARQVSVIEENVCVRGNKLTSKVLLNAIKKSHKTLIENLRAELAVCLLMSGVIIS